MSVSGFGCQTASFFFVMPGLDPGIHLFRQMMDRRIKSGDDDGERKLHPALF
jgi:hypothetical protein